MTKLAHLADLHFGYSHLLPRAADRRNQRLVDFEQAALLAADYILEEAKPDFAVIAGDALHDTNLYPAALSGAVSFCERFDQAGVPLVIIGGNHDEAEGTGRYNALKFLAAHYQVKLHLEQSHVDIADIRLHLVSFRVLSRALGGRGQLEPFEFATDRPNVLVTHGYAPGMGVPVIPEGTDTLIPPEWLSDPRFSLSLLGHIHHHGEIADRVFYAGSTERRNFGEASEKPGFYIHEVAGDGTTNSTSVFVEDIAQAKGIADCPRPMLSHEIDTDQMTLEEVSSSVQKWIDEAPKNSMLRVTLYNVSSELDRSRVRLDWERRHIKNGGFYFEAKVQTRRVSELLDINFAEPPADVGKGLLDYIAAQSHPSEVEKEQALEMAAEIIGDARDRVLAQEAE